MYVPYPRKRGPMGSAPYIGPRLGDGPIFEVSVSHLYVKERPGKLLMLASYFGSYHRFQPYSSAVTTGQPWYFTVFHLVQPYKWAWLWSLAVNDRLFVLKLDIKLARLSFHSCLARYLSEYTKFSPHKPAIWAAFSKIATRGHIFE